MKKSKLKANHYKMCRPAETVDRITGILQKSEIVVEEKAKHRSSIYTNSLRLVIKGTDIGTNGKGVNVSYAAASAYAEFMERLENQHLNSYAQIPEKHDTGFFLFPDEKVMQIDELLRQKDAFWNCLIKQFDISPDVIRNIQVLDFDRTGRAGAFISLPFWDYADNRCIYLPYSLYRPWYGSNGMCAGNSPEEALVQGMSEILERIAMKRIFTEKRSLPDIPENYLMKYPQIYRRFQKIARNDRYIARMIDCSFGGELPVAGLLVIEKNTGNFGLKLGCHPDFGIAMERTLTEASQGQDVFDFSRSSFLDFANEDVFSEINMANCFMTGNGQYPYQFLGNESKYSFCEMKDVSEKNNRELLTGMITKIQDKGYHVLIRDVSFMGFPAYHIIVPGLSETGVVTVEDYDMIYKLNHSVELFRNPQLVDETTSDELMIIMQHYSYRQYLSFFMHTEDVKHIPFENIGESVHFYQAAIAIASGNYTEGIMFLTMISQKLASFLGRDEEKTQLLALIYYLSAKQELAEHNKIMVYMRRFFDEPFCRRLDELFGERNTNPFDNKLFCKLVAAYKVNEIDIQVQKMMNNARTAMAKTVLRQQGII